MDQETIIIVSTFSSAIGLLAVVLLVLICQVSSLKRKLNDLQNFGKVRVQKLSLDTNDRNHAFHNPGLVPDEELSKRGYSMYVAEDVESGRPAERQTGGQLVEELNRELEARHQRQQAPPFLQSIQDNKRRTRDLANPVANSANTNTRQSDTNPNFIY